MLATCIFDYTITLSTLFVSISIMICCLEGSLVIILNLGLLFWDNLFIIPWISKTLSRESLGKISLILKISLMLLFKAWTYDLLLGLLTKSIIRFFLKNFFAWFRENKWKNPGNICLFVFRYVVGNTLVWCIPIKLCRYTFPEGFVTLVCFELVLARFLNSWKKVSCHKAKLGNLRNVFSCLVF